MDKNENLRHALDVSYRNGKPMGDMNAKRLLQYRAVLAVILRNAVTEFKGLTADEVEELIPQKPGEPWIADLLPSVPIEAQEPPISFDLRFRTAVSDKIKFNIFVDIEPQNRYEKRSSSNSESETYDLPKRAMLYGCKLFTSQTESMTKIDYNALCKCYSIWICFDSLTGRRSKKAYGAMSRYGMECRESHDVSEEELEAEWRMLDLLEVHIYRVGAEKEDQSELLKFLNALFNRRDKLSNYIPETKDSFTYIEKEAESMCDLSILYREEGREEGIEEGIEKGIRKGREEGMEEGRIEAIKNMISLMRSMNLPRQSIVDNVNQYYKLTDDEYHTYFDSETFVQ